MADVAPMINNKMSCYICWFYGNSFSDYIPRIGNGVKWSLLPNTNSPLTYIKILFHRPRVHRPRVHLITLVEP